ncbi:MAG: cold shock domain-containing protein [Gaiellaceae bacterium]
MISTAAGTVKWFDLQRDYGFIRPEQDGSYLFVHPPVSPRAAPGRWRRAPG